MYWRPLETAWGHKQTSISWAIREKKSHSEVQNTLVTATLISGSGDLKGPPSRLPQSETFRSVLSFSNRTRKMLANCTRTLLEKCKHCWLPIPIHASPTLPTPSHLTSHTYSDVSMPSRFVARKLKKISRILAYGLGCSPEKGLYKNMIRQSWLLFTPPIHSFLPVLAISKDQRSQRKSCISWFVDGSSEATEEELLTGPSAQWSPKTVLHLKSCHQQRVGRKLWTSRGSRELSPVLAEEMSIRKRRNSRSFSQGFGSSVPAYVWGLKQGMSHEKSHYNNYKHSNKRSYHL